MDPIIVVGMCPSGVPIVPGKRNPTLRNLEIWMDALKVRHYSFINTFDFPGKPIKKNVHVDRLQNACIGYNTVLALGNFASEMLGILNINHYMMPHPSPLNRKLNDKKWVAQMLKECSRYIK